MLEGFSNDKPGFIYIVKADDLIKVGSSRRPEERAKEISRGYIKPCELAYSVHINTNVRTIETAAHELLKAYNYRNEWFNCSIEIAIEAIGKAIAMAKELNPEIKEKEKAERFRFSLNFSEEEKKLLTVVSAKLALKHGKLFGVTSTIKEALVFLNENIGNDK